MIQGKKHLYAATRKEIKRKDILRNRNMVCVCVCGNLFLGCCEQGHFGVESTCATTTRPPVAVPTVIPAGAGTPPLIRAS